MPASYPGHLTVVLGVAFLFISVVLLYVRPYLQASSVTPYRTVYDPYQHAYWLCYFSLSPLDPHTLARC